MIAGDCRVPHNQDLQGPATRPRDGRNLPPVRFERLSPLAEMGCNARAGLVGRPYRLFKPEIDDPDKQISGGNVYGLRRPGP
jgi:hypothetical protein